MKMVVKIAMLIALMIVFGCQASSPGGSASGDRAAVATDVGSPEGSFNRESALNCYAEGADDCGPTVVLSYSEATFKDNPICSFMYFIPLISPILVEGDTSANNRQQAGIISYRRQVSSRSFYVACEFAMAGEGFSTYIFDPAGAIALRAAEVKPGETLTNLLDYIRFEGAGYGGIQVRGTIEGSAATVTQVDVEFNVRGRESPVTIGLYEVKAKNGQYSYANRTNDIVARVNTLTFRRSDRPRMGITVDSIARSAQRVGFLERFKGAVANLFIKPPKVDRLGNDTMLDFGYALLQQAPAFTFPKAVNLAQARIVPMDENPAPSRAQVTSGAAEGARAQLELALHHRP